jgi:hypothetical protein
MQQLKTQCPAPALQVANISLYLKPQSKSNFNSPEAMLSWIPLDPSAM